jgi:hypothetical protein
MLDEDTSESRPDKQQSKPPETAFAPPPLFKNLTVFTDVNKLRAFDPLNQRFNVVYPTPATTDNSNTHFAILALWAAQRHNVPMKRTLAAVVRRFYLSQGAAGTMTTFRVVVGRQIRP